FMQVDPLGAGYMGPDYSGVFVYTSTRPTVAVGNRVDIGSSVVANFYGQIQLNEVTIVVAGTGVAAPAPIVVTPAEVATGGARAAQLESVVVQVNSVTVTSVTPTL